MNRPIATWLALGCVALTCVPACGQFRRPRPTMPDGSPWSHGWLPSLDEGKAVARQSGKPLMVVLRCVP